MSANAPLRFLRTSVITAAVLGLAAGAHATAGGHPPPAAVMTLPSYRLSLPEGSVVMVGVRGFPHGWVRHGQTVTGGEVECGPPAPGAGADQENQPTSAGTNRLTNCP